MLIDGVKFEVDASEYLAVYGQMAAKNAILAEESRKLGITEKELVKVQRELERQRKETTRATAAQERELLRLVAANEREQAASAATATSTRAAGAAMVNLRQQLTDMYVSLQGGQSPFTVLSQQGPQIGEAMAAMNMSLGTMAAGLGVVAAVAVPLYTVWDRSADALAEYDRQLQYTTNDLEALEAGAYKIIDAQAELEKRIQKLRGPMTEQEAATYAEADAQKVYQDELAATSAALDNANATLRELKRRATDRSLGEAFFDLMNPLQSGNDRFAAIKEQEKEIERLKGNIVDLKGEQAKYATGLRDVSLGEQRATEGRKARSRATKEAKDAEKEAADALKDEIAALLAAEKAEAAHYAAIRKGIKALDDQAAAARNVLASTADQIEMEKASAWARAESTARIAMMEARTADERRAIERSLVEDKEAINAKWLADMAKMNEEAAKQAAEAARTLQATSLDGAAQVTSALASLTAEKQSIALEHVSALEDAIETAESKGQTARAARLKKRLAEERKAVLANFKAGQDLSRAGVVMDTAKAIMAAWALGPIAGPIGAAAATAAGAIELAIVNKQEPPKFDDTPGVMQGNGGTQRQIVSLDPRDKWLAARDMDGLMRQFMGAFGPRGGHRTDVRTPRNEGMLAFNAVGAYGSDIARLTRPGGI